MYSLLHDVANVEIITSSDLILGLGPRSQYSSSVIVFGLSHLARSVRSKHKLFLNNNSVRIICCNYLIMHAQSALC